MAADTAPTRSAIIYQFAAGVFVGLSAMVSGAWLAWPSAAIKPLLAGDVGFNVTREEISTMVALMDFGNLLTPIPASYFMDWVGRKPTLYSIALMNIAASVLCIWAQNMYFIYVGRICAGLAKGVTFTVVPIFLAEVASVQIRGALSTMFIGFLNVGVFYNYFFGDILTYDQLNIANFIIPVIFTVTFFFIPESPYYLMRKNDYEKAKNSLAKYRQKNKENKSLLQEADLIKKTVQTDMQNKARFIDIVTSQANRRALLILIFLAWFQRSSGISPTLAYSTITLPETGGGTSREVYMIIFSFILIVGNCFATPLVDQKGRKPLLIASVLSTALVQGTAGVYYAMESHGSDVSSIRWIPYVCLIALGITYSLGIGFVPSTLVGELFPMNVKTYAGSISAIILALTSFCINRMFREVADAIGVEYMYLYFTVTCILCAIYVYFFVFETKGKTFLEIQNQLNDL